MLAGVVIGGLPLTVGLFRRALAGQFGSDLLAGISIVTSAILGEYLAGLIVVLMLSGGTALEEYSKQRASSVLAALAKRMPRTAHRKRESGLTEIEAEDVVAGDTLVVFPHEICPADGCVIEGRGTMDESYLTGEPFQIEKAAGSDVVSGALNGEFALTIRVTQRPSDSRYARIVRVMRDAEATRPPMRRIADRLGAWYTPVALAMGTVGWLISGDPRRFLAVIVIATPCPLLLAIPITIIGAVSVAASRGIIIRNPAALDQLNACATVIFDKTGTLTYGRPALTEILCAPGETSQNVLHLAASLEQYSRHPLASAIREAAEQRGIEVTPASLVSEEPGKGLRGVIGSMCVEITGRNNIEKLSPAIESCLPPLAPGLECILLCDRRYAATFRFRDAPRAESRSFVLHLGPRHRIKKLMLLSGDRESEVRYLAGKVGISEVLFGKSPEEKILIVRSETAIAPTLFIGDGINDAPAMQAATVGVAFGANSDITAEAADAVVLEQSLRKLDELIHIGRRMRVIALQSAFGGMALSVIGMLVAIAGYLPPVAGALAQEMIDAAAVFNALRMALPSRELRSDS